MLNFNGARAAFCRLCWRLLHARTPTTTSKRTVLCTNFSSTFLSLADWLTNELARTRTFISVSCIPRPQNKEAPPASIASGSLKPWNFSGGDKRILIYERPCLIHLSRLDWCFDSSRVGEKESTPVDCVFLHQWGVRVKKRRKFLSKEAITLWLRLCETFLEKTRIVWCAPPLLATADLFSRSLSQRRLSFLLFLCCVCERRTYWSDALIFLYRKSCDYFLSRRVKINRGSATTAYCAFLLPPPRWETCASLNYL